MSIQLSTAVKNYLSEVQRIKHLFKNVIFIVDPLIVSEKG